MRQYAICRSFSLVFTIVAIFFCVCFKQPANLGDDSQKQYAGTISGVVTDKHGKPLDRVSVTIHADSAVPAVSKPDGSFEIGKVSEGSHRLYFSRADYDFDSSRSVSLSIGEQVKLADSVRLTYAWYIFKGKVFTKAGSPAIGGGVVLSNTSYFGIVDDQGLYIIDKIARQTEYRITCACGDENNFVRSVRGVTDDTTRVPDVHLTLKGATFSGTVYDTNNNPASACTVSAIAGILRDTTSSSGTYTLHNVPSADPSVEIIARQSGGLVGGISGMEIGEGGYAPAMDIYLRPAAAFLNGMAVET
jgi:hypothetical protein